MTESKETTLFRYRAGSVTLTELCAAYDVPFRLVHKRLNELGWTLEQALRPEVSERHRKAGLANNLTPPIIKKVRNAFNKK